MLIRLVYDENRQLWEASLEGDLDICQAAKLLERIQTALKEHLAKIDFDCKKLAYIDSVGLGALVKINALLKDVGGIRLYHVHPRVYKLLSLTKLDTLFQVEVITE